MASKIRTRWESIVEEYVVNLVVRCLNILITQDEKNYTLSTSFTSKQYLYSAGDILTRIATKKRAWISFYKTFIFRLIKITEKLGKPIKGNVIYNN